MVVNSGGRYHYDWYRLGSQRSWLSLTVPEVPRSTRMFLTTVLLPFVGFQISLGGHDCVLLFVMSSRNV